MSDIDICNQALSAIGARSFIQALTENSAEAQQCNIVYAPSRDELLRAYRWGFAGKQIALAVLRAAAGTPENSTGAVLPLPPQPWAYAYAYPDDCLMAWRIVPLNPALGTSPAQTTVPAGPAVVPGAPFGMPGVPFKTVQIVDAQKNAVKALATDQQQALLDYCAATTNPGLFDADFVTALVGRLAVKLIPALSGDKALAKEAIAMGAAVEGRAATRDANEGLTTTNRTADWHRARGAGGEWDGRWGSLDTVGSGGWGAW